MVQKRSQIHPDSTCKQGYQLTQNQKNIDIIELKPRNKYFTIEISNLS